jgi:PEP-CTERM motif
MKRLGWVLTVAAVAIFALTALSQPVRADTLDFGLGSVPPIVAGTGTVSYATAGGAFTGSGIDVYGVTDLTTSAGALLGGSCGTFACLSFTTGNFSSSTSLAWIFSGNPSTTAFTITGTATGIGSATALLAGYITGATVSAGTQPNTLQVAIIAVVDSINGTLLTDLGLSSSLNPWNGQLNLSFSIPSALSPGMNSTFTSSAMGSGDLLQTPVPEPASLFLLGSGLLGAGLFARKHLRKPDDTAV